MCVHCLHCSNFQCCLVQTVNAAPREGDLDTCIAVCIVRKGLDADDCSCCCCWCCCGGLLLSAVLLQVGDTGSLVGPSGTTLEVSDCQVAAGYVLHVCDAAGGCAVGV